MWYIVKWSGTMTLSCLIEVTNLACFISKPCVYMCPQIEEWHRKLLPACNRRRYMCSSRGEFSSVLKSITHALDLNTFIQNQSCSSYTMWTIVVFGKKKYWKSMVACFHLFLSLQNLAHMKKIGAHGYTKRTMSSFAGLIEHHENLIRASISWNVMN